MSEPFSLGKHGKFGDIDFSKIRSGITKEDLGIAEDDTVLSSIFDSIDGNELIIFIEKIKELAGNKRLSQREAKNYEVNGEKLGKNKEQQQLIEFLIRLAKQTSGVKEIEIKDGQEVIVFDDGHTEQILANGNKKKVKQQDEKTVTTIMDGDTVLEETIEDEQTKTVITNNPQTKKKTEVTTNKNTNIETTVEYDEDGETPTTKEVKSEGKETKYIYNKDQKSFIPVSEDIITTVEDKKHIERTEYDQEKSTEESRVEKSKTVIEDGKTISKTVGNQTVEYDGEDNTYIIVQPDERNPKAIAQKFGCDEEKLKQINGNRAYFDAGEKIKIPGKLEPDTPKLNGRLSSQDAKAQFEQEQEEKRQLEEEQERAAQAARERARVAAQRRRQTSVATGKREQEVAKGANGYRVIRDKEGNLHYRNDKNAEISPEDFKKACPTIYNNVNNIKTRKKYNISRIQNESIGLAEKLYKQIDGASLNSRTIGLLRTLKDDNIAYVIAQYKEIYGISLAKHIDNEWGLDINTVKEFICAKLMRQAKAVGLKCSDYTKINYINKLELWIDKVSEAVRNKMPNVTETYKAGTVTKTKTQGEVNADKATAKQIAKELLDSVGYIYNSHDEIHKALKRINSPEVLKEVENLLEEKGYKRDNLYSPIEKFIQKELQRGVATDYTTDELESYVQNWIKSGALSGDAAIDAQARMASRIIIDSGDGFGTDEKKTKKGIRAIAAPLGQGKDAALKVYQEVNSIISHHKTFYGIGTKSSGLIDYLKGEVWDSEIKYLKGILGENDAIQGEEKAQAVKDLVQESVKYAGTDIDGLKQAIKAINSPEDRKAIEKKLEKYLSDNKIAKQYAGQSALQAILYDECDKFIGFGTNHKEIRKFNEMLISQEVYSKDEAAMIRAEGIFLQIKESDFSNILEAISLIEDKDVLNKLNVLLQKYGLNNSKYSNIESYIDASTGLSQEKKDLIKAELAGNKLMSDENSAKVAFRLIQNSDFNNRAKGFMAIRTEQTAKLVDAELKKIGSSLAKEYDKFNQEKADYKNKSAIWDGLAFIPVVGYLAEYVSDEYRKNTDSSENTYIESSEARKVPVEKQLAYSATIKTLRESIAAAEKEYQESIDSQGGLSGAINAFCSKWNIGTTRDEIEARLEHDKETLRLLELAANGKLSKMVNGKTVAVSFDEVFKERQLTFFSANGALSAINTTSTPQEAKELNEEKVLQLSNKAELIGAMDYAKDLILVAWDELGSAQKSNDKKHLASAIYNTLNKLSQFTGENLSLADFGYKLNSEGIIVDSNGKEVPVDKLKEIIAQLKKGLSDISKNVLGAEIPSNTSYDDAKDILESAYDKKLEAFKQDFKDVFGHDAPDSMVEDYLSTINTGKTVVMFGAALAAAIAAPFTFGGSLAAFAGISAGAANVIVAGTAAGVTSFGLNALEKATDADGYTNEEWTDDAEEALWAGVLTACGMRVGMLTEAKILPSLLAKNTTKLSKFFTNPKHLDKAAKIAARAEALGFEVTSDSAQSILQMLIEKNGNMDSDTFWQAFAMSLIGNAAGHVYSGVKEVRGVKGGDKADIPDNNHEFSPSAERGHRDAIEDGEVVREADASHLDAKGRKLVDDAIDDSPTPEELDAYGKKIGYRQARPKRQKAIDENNARVREADAEAHRIENNLSEESAANLNRAKEGMEEVDATQNGIYKNDKAEFTIENGKVTKIQTSDGRVITDELKIAKYLEKNKIKLADLEGVKVEPPKPKAPEPFDDFSESFGKKDNDELTKLVDNLIYDRINGNASLYNQEHYDFLIELLHSKGLDDQIGRLHKYGYKHSTNVELQEIGKSKAPEGKDRVEIEHEQEVAERMREQEEAQKAREAEEARLREQDQRVRNENKPYEEMDKDELLSAYKKLDEDMGYMSPEHPNRALQLTKMKKINALLESKFGVKIKDGRVVEVKPEKAKETDNADGTKIEAKSFEKIAQKYGTTVAKAYQTAMDLINKVKDELTFLRAYLHIENNLGSFNEVRNKCLSSLQEIAKKYKLRYNVLIEKFKPRRFEIDEYTKGTSYTWIGDELPAGVVQSLKHLKAEDSIKVSNLLHGGISQQCKVFSQLRDVEYIFSYDAKAHSITVVEVNVAGKAKAAKSNSKQRAYDKFNPDGPIYGFTGNGGVIPKGRKFTLESLIAHHEGCLQLPDGTILNLQDPAIMSLIQRLDNHKSLTIGRKGGGADIELDTTGIADHQLLITKQGRVFVIQDISPIGETKVGDFHGSQSSNHAGRSNSSHNAGGTNNDAYSKYNPNAKVAVFERTGKIDPNAQYILPDNNLPVLTIFDGTPSGRKIDLNNNIIKNRLNKLQEGEWITIGRDGNIKIKNSTEYVSSDHIFIIRRNGKLMLVDISTNKKTTYTVKTKADNAGYGRESNRANQNEQAHQGNRANQSERQVKSQRPLSPEAQKIAQEAQYRKNMYNYNKEGLEGRIKILEDSKQALKLSPAKIRTYKRILGMVEDEPLTTKTLKEARRKKALELHSDRNQGGNDVEFQKVEDAYQKLDKYLNADKEIEAIDRDIAEFQKELDRINQKINIEEGIINNAEQMAQRVKDYSKMDDAELLDFFNDKHDKNVRNREDLRDLAYKRQAAFDELCNNRGYVPINDGVNEIPTHPSKLTDQQLMEEIQKGNNHPAITGELAKREKIRKQRQAEETRKAREAEEANKAKAENVEKEKLLNASADEIERMISKKYHSYRDADYSSEESLGRITQDELENPTVTPEKMFVWYNGVANDGWLWRQAEAHFGTKKVDVERISLNVKADRGLLEELDDLILNGRYMDKNGNMVKVDIPEGSYYKTIDVLEDWGTRQDPITMYFTNKLSQRTVDIIAEITQKYARKSANTKPLLNAIEGKPWIAHCAEPTADDFKALYNEALKLNKELAEAIRMRCGNEWYSSYGDYEACKQILNDYKAAMKAKPHNNIDMSKFYTGEVIEGHSHGFKRNPNAKTNVGKINNSDIGVAMNYTGYSCIAKSSNINGIDNTDIRGAVKKLDNGQVYALYNSSANTTAIGIRILDNFRRPGVLNILVKGQVSESDAVRLIEYLKSKKDCMPKNYSTAGYDDIRQLELIGKRIQEEVAKFFNNL